MGQECSVELNEALWCGRHHSRSFAFVTYLFPKGRVITCAWKKAKESLREVKGLAQHLCVCVCVCVCVCLCVCVCVHALSCHYSWLYVTPWTVAHQAPLSMGFSRQEYWSGLPCPPPGDLPHPGIKPTSLCLLHWQAGSLPSPLGSPCPTPAWLQKPGCSLDSQPSLWPPALAHGRRSVNTYWKKE